VHQRTIEGFGTSAVGVGELRLATADARGVQEIERTLHHALSNNLSFVDVADEEIAEKMAGDAVRGLRLRDSTLIATRVAALPSTRRDPLPETLPPGYVQERIEATLRATKLDALPLAMLPLSTAWLGSSAWPELAGALVRLTREGKVLRWGARLDLAAAERQGRLDDEIAHAAALRDPFCAISIAFSACDRRGLPLLEGVIARPPPKPKGTSRSSGLIVSLDDVADDPLLDDPVLAAMVGMVPKTPEPGTAELVRSLPILAREPLAGGALAGSLGPGMKLSPRDDRLSIDAATLERIAVALATLAPLVRDPPAAARSCVAARTVLEHGKRPDLVEAFTMAELALRFVLDRGAIALPRLHRKEHVTTAVLAIASAPLSTAVHERLIAVLA
jgi:aryl-alcohol dehydrogenase-like predicted oxidoreductase